MSLRAFALLLCFTLSCITAFGVVISESATAQDGGACADVVLEPGEVGFDYEGHCIVPDPAKGPVQGIFVRRVEDLNDVTISGIVLIKTAEGWVLSEDEFEEEVVGEFATVAVEDGWHMTIDKESP